MKTIESFHFSKNKSLTIVREDLKNQELAPHSFFHWEASW